MRRQVGRAAYIVDDTHGDATFAVNFFQILTFVWMILPLLLPLFFATFIFSSVVCDDMIPWEHPRHLGWYFWHFHIFFPWLLRRQYWWWIFPDMMMMLRWCRFANDDASLDKLRRLWLGRVSQYFPKPNDTFCSFCVYPVCVAAATDAIDSDTAE